MKNIKKLWPLAMLCICLLSCEKEPYPTINKVVVRNNSSHKLRVEYVDGGKQVSHSIGKKNQLILSASDWLWVCDSLPADGYVVPRSAKADLNEVRLIFDDTLEVVHRWAPEDGGLGFSPALQNLFDWDHSYLFMQKVIDQSPYIWYMYEYSVTDLDYYFAQQGK